LDSKNGSNIIIQDTQALNKLFSKDSSSTTGVTVAETN
jgi:hypothetical protein